MPEVPRMPTIPTVLKANPDNQYEVLVTLKMAVEMLMGTRGDIPVTRTFVQDSTPQAMNTGDLWIQTGNGHISYWNGANWQLTKAVP